MEQIRSACKETVMKMLCKNMKTMVHSPDIDTDVVAGVLHDMC